MYRRFEKERLRKEELRKAAAKVESDVKRSKYPKGVIVNEEAIRRQPIAKYQVKRFLTFKYLLRYIKTWPVDHLKYSFFYFLLGLEIKWFPK